jgi:hypothetical protein
MVDARRCSRRSLDKREPVTLALLGFVWPLHSKNMHKQQLTTRGAIDGTTIIAGKDGTEV